MRTMTEARHKPKPGALCVQKHGSKYDTSHSVQKWVPEPASLVGKKNLLPKADNLSSTAGTYMLGRKNLLPQIVL